MKKGFAVCRLVRWGQDVRLHGEAAAKGMRKESEKETGSHHQGGKHQPDGRRADWILPFPRALDRALPWPSPQQPQALRVFERDRKHALQAALEQRHPGLQAGGHG
jgi:hypothetical protein